MSRDQHGPGLISCTSSWKIDILPTYAATFLTSVLFRDLECGKSRWEQKTWFLRRRRKKWEKFSQNSLSADLRMGSAQKCWWGSCSRGKRTVSDSDSWRFWLLLTACSCVLLVLQSSTYIQLAHKLWVKLGSSYISYPGCSKTQSSCMQEPIRSFFPL